MRRPFSFGFDELGDRLSQLAGRFKGRKVAAHGMTSVARMFWRSM
jgi:hypothetical protein